MVDDSCYCYCLSIRPTWGDDGGEIRQIQGHCHLSYRTGKWLSVESSWKPESSVRAIKMDFKVTR